MTDLVPLNAVAERVAGLLDGTAPAAAGLTSPKPAEVAALLDVLARDKAGQPSGRPPGVFAVALPEDVPDRAVLVRVMEPPGGYDVVAVSPSGLVRPTLQVLAVVRSGAVGSPSRVLDLVQRRAFACLTSGVGPVSARTGALVGVPGTAAPASPLSIVAAPGPPQRFADDLLYTAARFTCGVYLS